jgi:hypothetical protein
MPETIEHFHTRIEMVTPDRHETFVTRDGEAYRGYEHSVIHVKPEHVTELEERGFRRVAPLTVAPEPEPVPAAPKRTKK